MFYITTTTGVRLLDPTESAGIDLGNNPLEMTIFNVGGGEAILLRQGMDGFMVDGGAYWGTGFFKRNAALGEKLANFLVDRKIKLLGMVASHPHLDHLNAISSMWEIGGDEIIGKGLELSGRRGTETASKLIIFESTKDRGTYLNETLGRAIKKNKNIQSIILKVKDVIDIRWGGLLTGQLFKDNEVDSRPKYESIFMSLTFSNSCFLFTGDSYKSYERKLVNRDLLSETHVLKITHHGSSSGTGSLFLDAVRPHIAVASTSDHATHRLEEDVKERIRSEMPDALILDTSTANGDLVIRTDGKIRTVGNNNGVVYDVIVENYRFRNSSQ
ncbi:MAG: hypothetical protein IIA61_02425 [Candidatus Marinimicrobia bacterium]|nr:hypothetical protein [Candidatus Neomarinimicrobiota bacterium]